MPVVRKIPPGRAGRMWLRGRLDTAERGRDQLDRKLRILIPEQQRLQTRAQQRREAWLAACEHAQLWLLRAAVLGGQDAIRGASPPQPTHVHVTWTSAMGLSYPEDAALAEPDANVAVRSGNAAIVPAATAFRAALLSGARAAAADEAVRRLEAEIAVTRRRARALDKRWLPWLRDALAALELTLEQGEQEDGMRLRRAVANSSEQRFPE
jgi:V/A-type H+-transporting ATPase subunit D